MALSRIRKFKTFEERSSNLKLFISRYRVADPQNPQTISEGWSDLENQNNVMTVTKQQQIQDEANPILWLWLWAWRWKQNFPFYVYRWDKINLTALHIIQQLSPKSLIERKKNRLGSVILQKNNCLIFLPSLAKELMLLQVFVVLDLDCIALIARVPRWWEDKFPFFHFIPQKIGTYSFRSFLTHSPDSQFGLTVLSYSVAKYSASLIDELLAFFCGLAGKPVSLIITTKLKKKKTLCLPITLMERNEASCLLPWHLTAIITMKSGFAYFWSF